MRFTYAPTGGPPRTWIFDPRAIPVSRARAIQKAFRGTFNQWHAGLLNGDASAYRVTVWHLESLENPRLSLKNVPDFAMKEVHVEYGRPEYEILRTATAANPDLDPKTKAEALAHIDDLIAALPFAENGDEGHV